jgi:hypothetical protein
VTWTPLSSPVDSIVLAGRQSPGIADVQGAGSPRRWDIRKGYALSGARAVFRGMDIARFRVRLRLYTKADWSAWHDWKAIVQRPPSGTRPQALDIWHPVLEDCGIASAVVEDVSQLEGAESGEWTVTISFIEHRPPLPMIIRTEGASATGTESEWQRRIRLEREFGEALDRELVRQSGRLQ